MIIGRSIAGGMSLAGLRTATLELLPLDAGRREESRVLLAFPAQAAVVPGLAAAADDAARRLQEPLTARIAHAIQAGELPAHLDPRGTWQNGRRPSSTNTSPPSPPLLRTTSVVSCRRQCWPPW